MSPPSSSPSYSHWRLSIVFLSFLFTQNVSATMGPLLLDTTALNTGPNHGGCIDAPGSFNNLCYDMGIMPSAAACASACDIESACSAMTWTGPTTGQWANHCVFRLDGLWEIEECGTGCDHTSGNKTAGWIPGPPPAPPPSPLLAWRPSLLPWGRAKAFWFGANSTGLDNDETIALISRHAVGGYGWQTGHEGGGTVGVGEELQAQAITHLADGLAKLGNNVTQIFSYRQIQVALRLFAQTALAADNTANDAFWLHDTKSGDLCLASQPWGTSDPYWNFSNSAATDYWIDKVIGELATEQALTSGGGAVFFDETDQGECGYRGGSCDFSAFNATALQAAKNTVYGRQVRALNSAGIVPILSLDNRLVESGNGLNISTPPCALPEDALLSELKGTVWVRFYENWPQSFWVKNGPDLAAAMLNNAILEAAAGVPTVLHMGAHCPAPSRNVTIPGRLGGDVEYAMATYLIVAGTGTTISLSSGWMDSDFCWRPDFDIDFGAPMMDAVRTGAYTFARNYTKATVTVDVRTSEGIVQLL